MILLLIPISKPSLGSNFQNRTTNNQYQQSTYTKAANDDVIEGEYTKIDDDKK